MRRAVPAAAAACLLITPAELAFWSGGYFEGPRLVAAVTIWVLLTILALGAGGPASPPLPRSAAARLALGGLAALTVWVLLSRAWAPLAGPAGDDAQRDVLYLGALACGVIAWRSRGWARAVEPLLALGAFAVIAYGLADRLLPGLFTLHHAVSAGGRMELPLTYWNAMGALAAIGFVLCTRLAGDRLRPRMIRVLGAGATPLLAVGLYTTFSRGAMGAAICGLLVLALLAPTWAQLRAIVTCASFGVVAAAIASRLDGVASVQGTLGDRETEGAGMLLALVALTLVVVASQAHAARSQAAGVARTGPLPLRRWGRVLLALAALAVAAFPYAAASAGEHGESTPAFGTTNARLSSVGTNRYAYWRVAVRTFADHPLKGAGAASFQVEWLRERPFPDSVRDAHSLYLETLAELGVVGFLALLALFAGVLMAIWRSLRFDPALACGPVAGLAVWAVHAGVDWDWEMPALTLVAITLAAVVLARSETIGEELASSSSSSSSPSSAWPPAASAAG